MGVCADCGKTKGMYIPRLSLCRACHYARTLLRIRRPNGPLPPAGADTPRPVCWCGEAAGAIYGGMCLKHWQQTQRPPPYDPVYAEDGA